FVFTGTLVWQRNLGSSTANNLDLFLYDAGNNNLVASSQSAANNVEHIFVSNLPEGRYDLQVFRPGAHQAKSAQSYALAFDFGPPEAPLLINELLSSSQFHF